MVSKTFSCNMQVQHLIEKCICYNMNKQECVQTLEKHANIQPVITSTGIVLDVHALLLLSLPLHHIL
jgi:hypothetical protein